MHISSVQHKIISMCMYRMIYFLLTSAVERVLSKNPHTFKGTTTLHVSAYYEELGILTLGDNATEPTTSMNTNVDISVDKKVFITHYKFLLCQPSVTCL